MWKTPLQKLPPEEMPSQKCTACCSSQCRSSPQSTHTSKQLQMLTQCPSLGVLGSLKYANARRSFFHRMLIPKALGMIRLLCEHQEKAISGNLPPVLLCHEENTKNGRSDCLYSATTAPRLPLPLGALFSACCEYAYSNLLP